MIKATRIGATVTVPLYGRHYDVKVVDILHMRGWDVVAVEAPWAGNPAATERTYLFAAEPK